MGKQKSDGFYKGMIDYGCYLIASECIGSRMKMVMHDYFVNETLRKPMTMFTGLLTKHRE